MNRRNIIHLWIVSVSTFLTGCGIPKDEGPPLRLLIFAEINKKNTGWELVVMVDNQNHRDVSIHDIMVVAFDENGDEVCRNYIGDLLKGERPDKTATLVCEGFPAIITATAEESPCNGANIMILYWIGDADQVELSGETGVILWKSTYQECDEPIPPRRVIENLGEIPKNE